MVLKWSWYGDIYGSVCLDGSSAISIIKTWYTDKCLSINILCRWSISVAANRYCVRYNKQVIPRHRVYRCDECRSFLGEWYIYTIWNTKNSANTREVVAGYALYDTQAFIIKVLYHNPQLKHVKTCLALDWKIMTRFPWFWIYILFWRNIYPNQ